MDADARITAPEKSAVDAVLAEPAIATLNIAGAPVVVARAHDLCAVWANGPARQLFRGDSLAEISSRAFEATQLGRLLRTLSAGGAPRLERVRLASGRGIEIMTFLCRRTAQEPSLFVVGAMGHQPGRFEASLPALSIFDDNPAVPSPEPVEPSGVARLRAEIIALSPEPTTAAASEPVATRDETPAVSARLRPEIIVGAAPPATPVAPPRLAAPKTPESPSNVARLRAEITASAPATQPPAEAPPEPIVTAPLVGAVADLTRATTMPEHARPPSLAVEPVARAPRSASEVAADLAARFDNSAVVRFLWKSDPGRRLTEITGELCAVVGCDAHRLLGVDFIDFARSFGAEPHERLLSAFARRETWSGVEILWPVAGADAAVPVTLGALPCHDRDQQFEGFRGFGVVHIQRVEPFEAARDRYENEERALDTEAGATGTAAPAPPTVAQPVAPAETAPTARAPATEPRHAASTAEPRDAGAPSQAEAEEELDFFEAMARMTAPPPEPLEAGPAGRTDTSSAPQAGRDVSEEEAETQDLLAALIAETGLPLDVVGPRADAPGPRDSAGSAASSGDLADAAPDEEPDALDRESSVKSETSGKPANVVPLRAGYRVAAPPPAANDQARAPAAADASKGPAPVAPPRDPSATVALTRQERDAFREIARALGAKAEADADMPRTPPEERASTPESRGLRLRDLIDDAPAEQPAATAEGAAARAEADAIARNAVAIFERLPTGVLVSRMEMPLFLNKALLDMLGFATADAFHKAGGLERMFRGREPRALAEAAGGGAIPIVTRTGDVVSAIARIQSIEWDGEPASMMTFRATHEADLAPRVRSLEAELRHRDADLRELHAILDTATDGVVVLDAEGRVLALNKSAEALFGYDQNEVAGEKFTTLLAKESHAAAEDYLEGLRTNGVASLVNQGREVIGRARQGGSIPVFMTMGRVSAAGPQKFCVVLRDITAWKKAEKELKDARRDAERASALKSEFLAKVSHEIRTPLNAIIGFAEVIMDERFGPVGNERYKDYLKDIHASGAHVMSLVNDLLDLSKIEAGKLDLEFGAVDVNRVIGECVSLMQPQATRDKVVIRQSLAQRLPNIVADERSLRQIVLNLLSNAVKFNEAGGQVIVSTALTDAGHAVIRIKDTGFGMTDAEVQTALEPFRQLHTARARGGTGLGLPLTKSLVEANRASFTIKSRKKEGTLVEVAFPPTRVLAE